MGIHWRALFGQESLKKTRSPNLFGPMWNPPAGTPEYRTTRVSSAPVASGGLERHHQAVSAWA